MLNVFRDIKEPLEQSGIVKRERTPVRLMLYGVFIYVLGLSLRKTASALAPLEIIISHVAVWKWYHKFGNRIYS